MRRTPFLPSGVSQSPSLSFKGQVVARVSHTYSTERGKQPSVGGRGSARPPGAAARHPLRLLPAALRARHAVHNFLLHKKALFSTASLRLPAAPAPLVSSPRLIRSAQGAVLALSPSPPLPNAN